MTFVFYFDILFLVNLILIRKEIGWLATQDDS